MLFEKIMISAMTLSVLLGGLPSFTQAGDMAAGKQIYNEVCKACHVIPFVLKLWAVSEGLSMTIGRAEQHKIEHDEQAEKHRSEQKPLFLGHGTLHCDSPLESL